MTRMAKAVRTRVVLAVAVFVSVAFAVWSSMPSRSAEEPNARDPVTRRQDEFTTGGWHLTIPPNTTGPRAWQGPLLDATAAAKQQFEETGIDRYQVTVSWACFCFTQPGHASAFRVTVRDGKIVELTALGYGSTESDDLVEIGTWDHVPHKHRWVDQWVPVERAYDEIAATSTTIDDAQARFNPRTGVPKWYSTDPRLGVTDDEFTVLWSDFKRLH